MELIKETDKKKRRKNERSSDKGNANENIINATKSLEKEERTRLENNAKKKKKTMRCKI